MRVGVDGLVAVVALQRDVRSRRSGESSSELSRGVKRVRGRAGGRRSSVPHAAAAVPARGVGALGEMECLFGVVRLGIAESRSHLSERADGLPRSEQRGSVLPRAFLREPSSVVGVAGVERVQCELWRRSENASTHLSAALLPGQSAGARRMPRDGLCQTDDLGGLGTLFGKKPS